MSAPNRPNPPRAGGPEALAAAMRLLAEGWQLCSVARQLGVRRQTLRDWRDSPEGQRLLAAARAAREQAFAGAIDDARRILREALPRAAQVLRDRCDSPIPSVAVAAAQAILDRAGLPRTEVVEAKGAVGLNLGRLSAADLDALEALTVKAREPG